MVEDERFKIFDENGTMTGTAMRSDVHRQGYWHETFHCWFISKEAGQAYIYLQMRSKHKKDFPNLLDITAAGHLLSNETVYDGVREVKEELGVDVSFDELVPVGTVRYSLIRKGFIDNEFAHVFLYEIEHDFDDYMLQKEEVSGMYRANFADFCQLIVADVENIVVQGFEVNEDGQNIYITKMINKDDFVPHDITYYNKIVEAMSHYIGEKGNHS